MVIRPAQRNIAEAQDAASFPEHRSGPLIERQSVFVPIAGGVIVRLLQRDVPETLIPLTAAETRRLFNLHTRTTRPEPFHQHWSDWRRCRQAAARKSHYARRLRNHSSPL
jgi:hypothetical protein